MRDYRILFTIISFGLLFFYKYSLANDNNIAPIEAAYNRYYHFNGIFADESRWEEEFKMLEEEYDHPNYIQISSSLAFIMVMPDHYIDKCPTLKKYLVALTKYHIDNTRISEDTRKFLNYIVEHQLSDKTDRNILTTIFNWFSWKLSSSESNTVDQSTPISERELINEISDYKVLCDFSGLPYLDFESCLLKDKKEPGHLAIASIVSLLAVMDREILKSSSCKVAKYVDALIQYYDNHKAEITRKHRELANLLTFIKLKLNDYGKKEGIFSEMQNTEL